MALAATFKGIDKQGGRVLVRVGKIEREFESMADVKRWARSARDDIETVHKLLVDLAIGEAKDVAAINANKGKQLTLDVAAVQKVTVT